MIDPNPGKPGIYFTRAKRMFVFQELNEYARIWDGSRWSTGFWTTTEAREHAVRVGWVNRGKYVETRKIVTWREV